MTKSAAMSALGREMRARRKGSGKTVQQFAFELGISDRQLRRYERGRCFPPEFRLKRIAELLDLEQGFFIRFFRESPTQDAFEPLSAPQITTRSPGTRANYIAGSFLELIEVGFSQAWLLEEAARLESLHPVDEIIDGFSGSNDMGDVAKWNGLLAANLQTAFGVIKSDKLVAHWFCLPVKQSAYNRAVAGENINAEIQLSDVAAFDFPQSYDFYFVDLYQSSDVPPWVVNKFLLDGFLDLLKSLAENGHFVRRMCTHAYAVETERICDKSGFNPVADHKYHARMDSRPGLMRHTKIYEVDFMSEEPPALLRYDDDLVSLYQGEISGGFGQNAGPVLSASHKAESPHRLQRPGP